MSWLKRLLGAEKKLDPIDLATLKLDLHSHLIPEIDDGSKSVEDSLNMLRRFKDLGFQKVITTPHVMSDFYRNTPEIINGGLEKVKEALKANHIELEIEAAAEYYLDEYFVSLIEKGELLTLGKNYVLFELPFLAEPPNLSSVIFALQSNGYEPILAHPERYPYWYSNFEKYRELKERGVHLQLNILSLIGHYSPQTQKIAERLIDEELISFLGTDCHHEMHLDLIEIARQKKYLHQLINSGKLRNAEFI